MKSIIIVSYEEDAHAQRVLTRAKEMGVKASLWDVSNYPDNAQVNLALHGSGTNTVRLNDVEIENLAGVYWRRPNGKYGEGSKNKMREYMRKEGKMVTNALAKYFPDVNWISRPGAEVMGGNKPNQLLTARKMGLTIPLTCITNSPEKLRCFLDDLGNRKMTMKPVGTAFMDLDEDGDLSSGKNKVVFTKIIDPNEIIDNLDMVRNCPVIFQEAIQKEFDLRVTVIDDVVYAAKIALDGCGDPNNLDWKNYEGRRNYSRFNLPASVQNQCVLIVRELGLRFGCVDLGVSTRGEYVFFEVNPQGQWLPSERQLGYDISGSIVQGLTK